MARKGFVRAIPAKMEGGGRGRGMPPSGCADNNAPASVRSKSGIHLKNRSGQTLEVKPLGVSGLVPADSSSGLGQGLVLTQDFAARHVDDHVRFSLPVLNGLAGD